MRLRVTTRAQRELSDILEYVARDSSKAAVALVGRIESFAETLSAFPGIGRLAPSGKAYTCPVPGTPYVLWYRIQGGRELQVLSVRHAKRRPARLF